MDRFISVIGGASPGGSGSHSTRVVVGARGGHTAVIRGNPSADGAPPFSPLGAPPSAYREALSRTLGLDDDDNTRPSEAEGVHDSPSSRSPGREGGDMPPLDAESDARWPSHASTSSRRSPPPSWSRSFRLAMTGGRCSPPPCHAALCVRSPYDQLTSLTMRSPSTQDRLAPVTLGTCRATTPPASPGRPTTLFADVGDGFRTPPRQRCGDVAEPLGRGSPPPAGDPPGSIDWDAMPNSQRWDGRGDHCAAATDPRNPYSRRGGATRGAVQLWSTDADEVLLPTVGTTPPSARSSKFPTSDELPCGTALFCSPPRQAAPLRQTPLRPTSSLSPLKPGGYSEAASSYGGGFRAASVPFCFGAVSPAQALQGQTSPFAMRSPGFPLAASPVADGGTSGSHTPRVTWLTAAEAAAAALDIEMAHRRLTQRPSSAERCAMDRFPSSPDRTLDAIGLADPWRRPSVVADNRMDRDEEATTTVVGSMLSPLNCVVSTRLTEPNDHHHRMDDAGHMLDIPVGPGVVVALDRTVYVWSPPTGERAGVIVTLHEAPCTITSLASLRPSLRLPRHVATGSPHTTCADECLQRGGFVVAGRKDGVVAVMFSTVAGGDEGRPSQHAPRRRWPLTMREGMATRLLLQSHSSSTPISAVSGCAALGLVLSATLGGVVALDGATTDLYQTRLLLDSGVLVASAAPTSSNAPGFVSSVRFAIGTVASGVCVLYCQVIADELHVSRSYLTETAPVRSVDWIPDAGPMGTPMLVYARGPDIILGCASGAVNAAGEFVRLRCTQDPRQSITSLCAMPGGSIAVASCGARRLQRHATGGVALRRIALDVDGDDDPPPSISVLALPRSDGRDGMMSSAAAATTEWSAENGGHRLPRLGRIECAHAAPVPFLAAFVAAGDGAHAGSSLPALVSCAPEPDTTLKLWKLPAVAGWEEPPQEATSMPASTPGRSPPDERRPSSRQNSRATPSGRHPYADPTMRMPDELPLR